MPNEYEYCRVAGCNQYLKYLKEEDKGTLPKSDRQREIDRQLDREIDREIDRMIERATMRSEE